MAAQMRKLKRKSKKPKSKKVTKISLKDKIRPIVQELIAEILKRKDPQDEVLKEFIAPFPIEAAETEIKINNVNKYLKDRRDKKFIEDFNAFEKSALERIRVKEERMTKAKGKMTNRLSSESIPETVKSELRKIAPWTTEERNKLACELRLKYDNDVACVFEEMHRLDSDWVKYKKENIKKIVSEL